MITDVLLAHRWLMPAVLAAFVVVGPLGGAVLVPRPRVAWSLALLSLVPLVALTLVPVDRELFSRCEVGGSLPTPARVELFANLVLFVAPTYLAAVASRRPLAALAAAWVLSAGIETLQALVPAIGRSCDTSDWLSNALGAVVGVALVAVALRRNRRRGTREPLPA